MERINPERLIYCPLMLEHYLNWGLGEFLAASSLTERPLLFRLVYKRVTDTTSTGLLRIGALKRYPKDEEAIYYEIQVDSDSTFGKHLQTVVQMTRHSYEEIIETETHITRRGRIELEAGSFIAEYVTEREDPGNLNGKASLLITPVPIYP